MTVCVNNQIHFKVSETFSVSFRGSLVYTGTVGYVGGFGGSALSNVASFEIRMAAVPAQFSAFICLYDIVYGLD